KKLTPSGTETKSGQNDSNESNHLMGSVRYENRAAQNIPREEIANAEDLHVAPSHEDEEPISAVDVAEENLKNDVASIQSEINSLIEVVSHRSKEEGISLFKTLLSNYPQFIGTTYQQLLSQMLHDASNKAGPHHFELSEINSWWIEREDTSSNNQ
ncbi:MAG: hypothetical protein WD824_00370, partial [Cyclobacteriaceae bacterium]